MADPKSQEELVAQLKSQLGTEARARVVIAGMLGVPPASRVETVVGAVALRIADAAEASNRAAALAQTLEQVREQAKRDGEAAASMRGTCAAAAKQLQDHPDRDPKGVGAVLMTVVMGIADGLPMSAADVARSFAAIDPVPPVPPELPVPPSAPAGDPPA